MKRRKSCELSHEKKPDLPPQLDGEVAKGSTTARDEKDKSDVEDDEVASTPPRPFLIAHTDIMYIPMKGRLFCRACL